MNHQPKHQQKRRKLNDNRHKASSYYPEDCNNKRFGSFSLGKGNVSVPQYCSCYSYQFCCIYKETFKESKDYHNVINLWRGSVVGSCYLSIPNAIKPIPNVPEPIPNIRYGFRSLISSVGNIAILRKINILLMLCISSYLISYYPE